MVAQAAIREGLTRDPRLLLEGSFAAAELDVGGGEVAEALASASVVIVFVKGGDPRLQFARQVGVFEQYAVVERLMPAPDLALRLRMVGAPPMWSCPGCRASRPNHPRPGAALSMRPS